MGRRIAVVGAGLAGLSAANELLDLGREVVVFDRAEPGGRAATTEHDGYRLNRGPHALYAAGEAARALADWGIDVPGHAPSQKGALGLRDGELHLLPGGVGSLARTGLLGPGQKVTLASLLGRLGRIAAGTAGTTVDQWVAGRTGPGPLADLLHGLIRLTGYANAPGHLDAEAALTQLAAGIRSGVLYLDGGWQGLIDGLARRATVGGATLERGTVTGAADLLDGFDGVVVAAGGPAVVAALTGAEVSEVEAGPPVEAAVLELGVRGIPDRTFVLGLDQPVYGSVHSPPTDLAPAGHAVVCLARYLAPGERHDADTTRAELTALSRRMGVAADDIEVERYLHRMTVAHGLPLARRHGLVGRPDVDLAGDPRITVAGDWVGPHGMLADAAVASGRRAARTLAGAGRSGAVAA